MARPSPRRCFLLSSIFFLAGCDPQSLVEYWERQRNAQGFPKLPRKVLQNDIDDLFSGIGPFDLLEHADPEGSRQTPAHSAGSSGEHSASSRATTAAAGAREQNATIGLRRVGRTRPASAMQAIALKEKRAIIFFATRHCFHRRGRQWKALPQDGVRRHEARLCAELVRDPQQ